MAASLHLFDAADARGEARMPGERTVDLERLIALCPSPVQPERPEHPSSLRLPADYRAMLRHYGPGVFDEFLWILDPASANIHQNLWERTRMLCGLLRARGRSFASPVGGSGEVNGSDVIQWGATDNGDSLFWLPVGAPDSWPTVILEVRFLRYLVVPAPAVSLLHALLSGELRTDILPVDFPSDRPGFTAASTRSVASGAAG